MENNEFNLNGIFYNENNEFIPLTSKNGNINGDLAHLRNTYLEVEKRYFEKLLEKEEIRNRFYAFIHYDSARLFQCAMEIQYKLETGSLETKEELEKMKLLSPEQRDALHNKNLESAEGLMCLLFAAARDKVNILELVKTLPNSRTR